MALTLLSLRELASLWDLIVIHRFTKGVGVHAARLRSNASIPILNIPVLGLRCLNRCFRHVALTQSQISLLVNSDGILFLVAVVLKRPCLMICGYHDVRLPAELFYFLYLLFLILHLYFVFLVHFPVVQNLHSLYVLDSCVVVFLVLVATERV